MPQIAPQTINNELLNKLEVLYAMDGPLNEFEIRSIYRQAEHLAARDAAAANVIKAGLEALQWNKEAAYRLMDQAIRLEHSSNTLFNCSLNCKFVNDFDQSTNYIKKALKVSPNDLQTTQALVDVLANCGRFKEACEAAAEGAKRGLSLDGLSVVTNIANDVNSLGISEARLIFEINAADYVLTDNKVRRREIIWKKHADPDGGQCLVLKIEFSGDFEDEIRLESQLAERLISEPGWDPSLLSIEFRYVSKHALQAA